MRAVPAISALAFLTVTAIGCASRADPVRFATYNSSLSRESPGELLAAMRAGDDEQAGAVAAVIQAARPDVLVLQEFDHGPGYDPGGEALRLFRANYLAVGQNGRQPIFYEHAYLPPSNTGVPTGVDLNGDGLVAPTEGAEVGTDAYAADCHGWGKYPGHYAFVILSKHPIDREGIRTFGELLWKDLPGNHIPPGHYGDDALAVLRLSSKNHVDVPVEFGGGTIHVLAAHPTPPVFDGPEDRNGRRNLDEVAMLTGMFDPSQWLLSDEQRDMLRTGARFELVPGLFEPFVILGDLNADPHDGDSFDPSAVAAAGPGGWCLTPRVELLLADPPAGPVEALLEGDDASRFTPTSPGGVAAAERQGGVNATHEGDPAADTADWDDERGPGNLRVDYVLPSNDLETLGGGVFWPTPDAPLMGVGLATVERASDHRLVWVDVRLE